MDIEKLDQLYKLSNLLLYLSAESVDYSISTEEEVLEDFVRRFSAEGINLTITEGRQVLAMEPFPWEWVAETRGYYSCEIETKELIEDPEFYKNWLQDVLLKLENEAKKQGKLEKTDERGMVLSESTSFPDIATANKFIKETIRQNTDKIARWLGNATVDKRSAFSWEFEDAVGYGFDKNGQYFDAIKKASIVIVRTKESFAVYTAYPLLGKGNNIETERFNQLYEISNLLLYLSAESVDYTTTTEEEILEDFVNRFEEEDIIATLKEGRQVLAIQPFPWEWIAEMRGYYSCDIETRTIIEDPKFYHKWLQTVLEKLEGKGKHDRRDSC